MANQPEWLNPRSAAIPILVEPDGLKVVLVTTKAKRNPQWIFPKGQIELGLSAHLSAAKEAFEEAGVSGTVTPTLFDEYQHDKWGGKMGVKVYLLNVIKIYDVWMEMHERQRQVVTLDSAIEQVQSAQKQTLLKLKQHLQGTP